MININTYIENNLLKIKVVPNSNKTELVEKDKILKLYLKAVPEKGKANQEIIKFFKKEYKLKVSIKHGLKSKNKVLQIL